MLNFATEEEIFSKGCGLLGAIDEAGRGPLAGPVVAAAVLIRPDFIFNQEKFKLIRDSKKLSESQREEAYCLIMEEFPEVGVGWCDHQTIDRINILQATFLAMKKALGALKGRPDLVIVDGKFKIPNISQDQRAIIRGDATVFSIAAASIIAKVTRDRMMRKFHEEYPAYDFAQHKGYGTKMHLEKIREHGPSPIHRLSFAPLNADFLVK
jgi:ribonuclease HII